MHRSESHQKVGLRGRRLASVGEWGGAFLDRDYHWPRRVLPPRLVGFAARAAPRKVGWEDLACGFWPGAVGDMNWGGAAGEAGMVGSAGVAGAERLKALHSSLVRSSLYHFLSLQ